MKQCDLCNERFRPPKDTAENAREDRYCHLCCTDPYRRLMCQIHETIGISGYTIREINNLESQKATLLAACKKALSRLTHSEESTTYADELRSAIELATK